MNKVWITDLWIGMWLRSRLKDFARTAKKVNPQDLNLSFLTINEHVSRRMKKSPEAENQFGLLWPAVANCSDTQRVTSPIRILAIISMARYCSKRSNKKERKKIAQVMFEVFTFTGTGYSWDVEVSRGVRQARRTKSSRSFFRCTSDFIVNAKCYLLGFKHFIKKKNN